MNDLFKSVILHTTEEDNPTSKLRALMLKSVSGKRDLGQCEVSRLLLSEPMYSSSFEYFVVSIELKQQREVNLINSETDDNLNATKFTLMDHYLNRHSNPELKPMLERITSFYSFIKLFKLQNNTNGEYKLNIIKFNK